MKMPVPRTNIRYLSAGFVIVFVLTAAVITARQIRPVHAEPQGKKDALPKVLGPAAASVEILIYSDFQCPACREASSVLKQLAAAYPRQVRLEYRHFPLSGHMWAPMAHQAAECANEAGAFWPYHDKLYENQLQWSVQPSPLESFLMYARDLGLNLDAFGSCMTDAKVSQRIAAEKESARHLQINSTPTFFINGERVVGVRELKATGDALIRKHLGLKPAAAALPEGIQLQMTPAAQPAAPQETASPPPSR